MNSLAIIESIQNFFDCGVFIESFRNSLRVKIEMGLKDFIRQLLFVKGYTEVTPPDLSKQMEKDQDLLIVDLRDKRKYEKAHIKGAVSHPFDDFLRSVLVDAKYREFKEKELVLICDTGHQSRVAAGILTEEGFVKVSSLKRGMCRWNKWQDLLRAHESSPGIEVVMSVDWLKPEGWYHFWEKVTGQQPGREDDSWDFTPGASRTDCSLSDCEFPSFCYDYVTTGDIL